MERCLTHASTSCSARLWRSAPPRKARLVARAEPGRAPPRREELRDQYDGYDAPPRRFAREEFAGEGGYEGGGRPPPPPPPRGRGGWLDSLGGPVNGALLAGVFVLGIGAGVALDTEVSLNRDNVASIDMVDRLTPNSAACAAYGASAVVFDQRIFMSFNPCVPTTRSLSFPTSCKLRNGGSVFVAFVASGAGLQRG